MRQLAGMLLVLFIVPTGLEAVSGTGSFENEFAMEWVSKLTRTSDTALVYKTLEEARKHEFIGERAADTAIAAAEVVAAMLDRPSPEIPPDLATWIKRRKRLPTASQVNLARDVLARVLDPKTSELAAFWPANDPEGWRKEVTGLLNRLTPKSTNARGLSNNPYLDSSHK
jgi:hypothetical protein